MTVEIESAPTWSAGAHVRARPVFCGLVVPDGSPLADAPLAARQGFTGALGETASLERSDGAFEILVGMGEPAELDGEAFRRAGAALAGAAAHCESAAFDLSGLAAEKLDAPVRARRARRGGAARQLPVRAAEE